MTAAAPTTTSTPRLSEVARRLVIPEGITTSLFPQVYHRLQAAGIEFDLWQQGWSQVALGCRENGKFATTVGGNVASIPRQVAKTFMVSRINVGLALEIPDFQVAWTSHHNRTTARTFQHVRALVRRKSIYPLLDHSTRSDGIRAANGQEEIRFKNGSLIMFGAREQGFGRGMDEVDVIVFDEAQILTLRALEDMVPAVNQARNPYGGLLFFLGTPPRPSDPGEAFASKRDQAINGRSTDIFYTELSADPDSDPDDESQWPIMNPSYPLRTPRESMLRMRENIPDDDSWNREARGIWDEFGKHLKVVSPERWAEMVDLGPADSARPEGFGVDMSHAREISVSACWVEGESAHVEEVWAGTDSAQAIDWIATAAGRRLLVVIDSASPAMELVPGLLARGVKVKKGSAVDMVAGCGAFEARSIADTLTHAGQPRLNDAVRDGCKRPIRDAGGWGWDRRKPSSKIHPAVSATLALLAAMTRKRGSSTRREATVQ